jgi:hypothetical protein
MISTRKFFVILWLVVFFGSAVVPAGKGKPDKGTSRCELSLSADFILSSTIAQSDGLYCSLGPQYCDDNQGVNIIAIGEKGNASPGAFLFEIQTRKNRPAQRDVYLNLTTFDDWDWGEGLTPVAMRIRALDFCQMGQDVDHPNPASIGFWMAVPDPNVQDERLIVDYGLYQSDTGTRCGQMVTVTLVETETPRVWEITGAAACLREGGINGPLLDGGNWGSGYWDGLGEDTPFFMRLTEIP